MHLYYYTSFALFCNSLPDHLDASDPCLHMLEYSVAEKFDLHFKPFTKKNFHFLVVVESAASQFCFSGPDKRSVTSIRYNNCYLLPRERCVSNAGWQTIPKACVVPSVAVHCCVPAARIATVRKNRHFQRIPCPSGRTESSNRFCQLSHR